MVAKVVFTINGQPYIYDPNAKTYEGVVKADDAEESRILNDILAGDIKRIGIA